MSYGNNLPKHKNLKIIKGDIILPAKNSSQPFKTLGKHCLKDIIKRIKSVSSSILFTNTGQECH